MIAFCGLFESPDAGVGRRELKQRVLAYRVVRKLLKHALKPSDRFGGVAVLYKTASDLINGVRHITAVGELVNYRVVMKAGISKIAIELVDRRPPEMLTFGNRSGTFCGIARVQRVESFYGRKCKIVGLCGVRERVKQLSKIFACRRRISALEISAGEQQTVFACQRVFDLASSRVGTRLGGRYQRFKPLLSRGRDPDSQINCGPCEFWPRRQAVTLARTR